MMPSELMLDLMYLRFIEPHEDETEEDIIDIEEEG